MLQTDLSTRPVRVSMQRLFFTLLLATLAMPLLAQDESTGKSGKDYISVGIAFNEFRSVFLPMDSNAVYDTDGDYAGSRAITYFPETAQTYGAVISYGSYINDYFKTELRMGKGIRDDTIKEALDINLAYWFSWYLGFQHPITDYMSGYFMYGITHFEADETRRQVQIVTTVDRFGSTGTVLAEPSPEALESGLFGTNFSPSWALGLEFSLIDNWFLGVEYGRLLRDTDSNIKVRQAGAHLRYEF